MAQGQAEEGCFQVCSLRIRGKFSEPGHRCLSVQAFHSVKCAPCLLLPDNTLVGSSLQLLCKCHFLNWLPGAGLQTASCGPGAMLGSSQGKSLPFLLGRYHHLHCLAKREAWQEVERAWVNPELVSRQSPHSYNGISLILCA